MKRALILFVWLVLLTGLVYPLTITIISKFTMNEKASGTILKDKNNNPIGSSLVGQKFESDRYFWSRPSAIDYNSLSSGGSNLGPTSSKLQKLVEERKNRLGSAVPSDLLFASASGLDPHITPEAAFFQVERISKARGLGKTDLEGLIKSVMEKRYFLCRSRVNVLILNLKLDEYEQQRRK